jgi:hypothetical protein
VVQLNKPTSTTGDDPKKNLLSKWSTRELQGEKTTQNPKPQYTQLHSLLTENKRKNLSFLCMVLSPSFPSPPVFSIFSTYFTLLALHFYLVVVHKHKGIIPLYRKTIVCLEGSGMFHPHQEDSLFLEDSGMFHQHQEDSFFLEKETIVDLCRTQEKVPEDSTY